MNNWTELLDDYLEGNLLPEQAVALEKHLADDPKLSEELALRKTAREVVIRAGKAKQFRMKIEKNLEEKGFFEQYKDKIPKEIKPNFSKESKWLPWAAILIVVLISLSVFQQYQIRERIARIEEHLDLNDSLPRVHRINDRIVQHDTEIDGIKHALEQQNDRLSTHWERVDSALKLYGIRDLAETRCRLSPEERKKWYADFLQQEIDAMVNAGARKEANTWREQFKIKNDSAVLQILRDMAETAPKNMKPLEYYVLGSMCLLYEQNPSESVWYLEKAKDVMRPYHAKFLLAAYLENDQQNKAKQWAAEKNIPESQWPKGAFRCLK